MFPKSICAPAGALDCLRDNDPAPPAGAPMILPVSGSWGRSALPPGYHPAPFWGARADERFVVGLWPFANETSISVFGAPEAAFYGLRSLAKSPPVPLKGWPMAG